MNSTEGEGEGGCGYDGETRIGLPGVVGSIHFDRDHKTGYSRSIISLGILIATSNILIREIEYPLSQAENIMFMVSVILPINNTFSLKQNFSIQKLTANLIFCRPASIEAPLN